MLSSILVVPVPASPIGGIVRLGRASFSRTSYIFSWRVSKPGISMWFAWHNNETFRNSFITQV